MATRSHPTTKKRNRKQKVKEKYSKAREDAQLAGVIETTPAGAVRDEAVDPASQDEQRFPGLDRLAIREEKKGKWHVPDHVARKVIEVSSEVLFEKRIIATKDGDIEVPPDRKAQLNAARVLQAADNSQYERDNPEASGKAKGGVKVEVNTQVNVVDEMSLLLRMAEEQRRCQALEDKIKQEQQDDVRRLDCFQ